MRAKALVALVIVTAALVGMLNPTTVSAHSVYTVKDGEALEIIAARLGMSVARLAALNGLTDPNTIYAGQVLITAEPERYTVRAGDVLSGIAERLSISQSRLVSLNDLGDPDEIYEGQSLVVAGATTITRDTKAAEFLCPVPGASFVNDYGYTHDGIVHRGVDLFALTGTPVVAPVGGRVVRYPNNLGGLAFHLYGNDGVRYYGAHLSEYGAQGWVAAGTVIGYIGNTGDAIATSPHLHFEMRPGGGDAVSPYPSLLRSC